MVVFCGTHSFIDESFDALISVFTDPAEFAELVMICKVVRSILVVLSRSHLDLFADKSGQSPIQPKCRLVGYEASNGGPKLLCHEGRHQIVGNV